MVQPKTLSVVIITKNEEENLPRCLDSVAWVDEIIIVDSGSTDQTIPIAKNYHAKIFEHLWQGYGPQKIFAVNQATKDWILNMDADEVVSSELHHAILDILENGQNQLQGYQIFRRTNFLGRWMDHCWGKEYRTRLFKKGSGNFDSKMVHESLNISGPVALIHAPLYHYSYPNLKKCFFKFTEYARLSAEQNKYKKKSNILIIFSSSCRTFLKMYFLKKGFLDGIHGLILSIFSSYHSGYKYFMLWKIQNSFKQEVKTVNNKRES